MKFLLKDKIKNHFSIPVLLWLLATTPVAAEPLFAIIGDFGDASANQADVAGLLYSWNPDFIITTGDNRYDERNYDEVIGQFYCNSLANAGSGIYCPGNNSATNQFFPSLGNHDYDDGDGLTGYLDYFSLPGIGINSSGTSGNERYYDFISGSVHFFVIDSEGALGDPADRTTQMNWLQTQLAASATQWQIVYFHHAPYSSSSIGSDPAMQWPFASWGADAVIAGHEHTYERLFADGIAYFVNGLGGEGINSSNFNPLPESQVQYNDDFGAMLVNADNTSITFEFINVQGSIIDSHTILAPGADTDPPTVPDNVSATAFGPYRVDVSWTESTDVGGSVVAGYQVYRSDVGLVGTTTSPTFSDNSVLADTTYEYTVLAYDNAQPVANESSQSSPPVSILTPPASTSTPFDVRVSQSFDDVEESPIGEMYFDSSDLELGTDQEFNGDQTVGLRFQNVAVPQGATITAAYLEFEVDEVGGPATSVNIVAEASDNSPAFTTGIFNLSNRPTTVASVAWNVPAWNTLNQKHQSPDLSSVVQEVVNRDFWSANNSLAIVIAGSGARTAESFDGEPAAAPLLHIEYTVGNVIPDLEAPTIPTNVSAAAFNSNRIDLNWDASVDFGGGVVAGYRVFRSDVGLLGVVSDLSFSDTTVDPDTSYDYTVLAFDDASPANESAESSPPANAVTPPIVIDVQAPSVPINVSAIAVSTDQVDLSWSASTDLGGGVVAGYRVFRSDVGLLATTTDVSFSDTTVAADTSYDYTVLAFDNASPTNESAQSSPPANVTTPPIVVDVESPTIPTNLSAIAPSTTRVDLSWSASTDLGGGVVAGYRVFRSDVGLIGTVTGLSFSDTSVVANTSYDYSVLAFDNATPANESAQSTPAVSVLTPPVDTSTSVDIRVSQSLDDVEESPIGEMYFDSSDLELGTDQEFNGDQTVGLRFQNVDVPRGATITAAYLEFEVDEVGGPATSVSIVAEASDNSPAFTTGNFNLSNRPTTLASVAWDVPAWNTVNQKHQSPDLSSVVQEVVNRSLWSASNSLVMIIDGSGARTAEAFDGEPAAAPLLHIEYTTGGATPDVEAPTIPTNVAATAIDTNQVDLSWNASTDLGGGVVAGYRVFRSDVGLVGTVTGISFTDTSVAPDTSYDYTVLAFDDASPANESAQSSPAANAVTPPIVVIDVEAPTIPTNVSATAIDTNRVDLSWSASTDLGGGVVAGYRVFRSDVGLVGTVTGISFSDTSVAPDTSYDYTVLAFDDASPANESAQSSPAANAVTPPIVVIDVEAPTIPTNVTATAIDTNRVDLTWNASTDLGGGVVAGYRVFRSDVGLVGTVTGISFSDTSVAPDTSYDYTVLAFDDASPANESAQSSPAANAVTPPIVVIDVEAPTIPTNVSATAIDTNRVDLSWSASTDLGGGVVAGYRVFRIDVGLIGTVTGLSFSDTSVVANTSYDYSVLAFDNATPANESAQSTPAVSVLTPPVDTSTSVDIRVSQSLDDVEESPIGEMYFDSSDLELGTDQEFNGDQTVGLRFQNVDVPRGATITAAYLEFEVDEVGGPATSVSIVAEASDNSPAFTTGNFNLSNRPTTLASVAWDVPAWNTVNQKHQSPDLSSVVQEVVNRSLWSASNSLVMIIDGSGARTAEAFDGEPAAAPLLHIEYTTEGVTPDIESPTIPTNLTAVAPNTTRIDLSWNASTDLGGGFVAGYRVFRSDVGLVGTVTGLSFSDTSVVANTSYDYSVLAFDNASPANESVQSSAVNILTPPVDPPISLDVRVSQSLDDVEESPIGEMYFDSSDLELGTDEEFNGDQTVGLRFQNLDVPQGATITAAYLEFEVDEAGGPATSVSIAAEASDDSSAFTTAFFNLSNRPTTFASVAWDVPTWNAVNQKHQSPDLSSVVQEVVSRGLWNANNSLVFVVSGSGTRTAESFDGEPASAPLLHIEYIVNGGG